MIRDDWANIGSATLDLLSMCINRGLNLAFHERGTIEALEKEVFQLGLLRSKGIGPAETQSFAIDFAEALADQL